MFDKVIFVDLLGGKPVCIFDKSNPRLVQPFPYVYENSSITVVHSPIMRVGKSYNLNEIYSNEPLIPKKSTSPD